MGKVIENGQVREKLPEGWQLKKLGNIATTSSGTTPSRVNKNYYIGSIPWVKTGELQDGYVDDTEEHISEVALKETSLKLLPPGTLLIAMYGQGQTRGRTGLLKRAATTNQACFAILPQLEIFIPEYLQLWFRHSYNRIRQETEGRGGNQPNLNGELLREQEIPLPSLPEQKRIVGILSDRLSAVEQARAATSAQLAAAKALPAAYLRQVFDSPEAQKWKRKKLGDVAILERGKFSPRPRNDPRYYGGEYPWIQTGIVERSGKYIRTYSNTLNEEGLEVSRLFPKGTLVITIAANIGAIGILDFDSCMPDSLVGIIPKEGVSDTDFLYYFLFYIRAYVQSIAPQAAQANLKLSLLNPIEIPCPALDKQKELAAMFSKKIEQAESIQQALQAQLDTIDQLPAALLRQAFNGEL